MTILLYTDRRREWVRPAEVGGGIMKTIDEVMAAQQDLVEPLATFEPRLVKMAGGNEPAED